MILDRDAGQLAGATRTQLEILRSAGVQPLSDLTGIRRVVRESRLVVDALIGYGLRDAPRGRTAELIEISNWQAARVLALDVPSGVDATTGATPGSAVRAERTLTLALPKTGLSQLATELYLADIGIPPSVYARLGWSFQPPFRERYSVRLIKADGP